MSWSRTKSTGSGSVAFRLQIEGFPYEPVTHADMEGTAADGRKRYVGLRSDRFKLKERVDLPRAKWEPEGFRVVVADINRQWTEAFRIPTAVTWLDGDLTAAATQATVKSTGAFTSSQKLWCDTEVMSYTSANTAGTLFKGLGRGKYNTLAQNHYSPDGENQRNPEITNWPRVREGRRVSLYVYGAGDDRTDASATAGTLIWTGVVSTEPIFNGLEWEFSIDPITRKWDQDIGGDLGSPATIRGIYYPASSPLIVEIGEGVAWANAWVLFSLAGFWESQEAFLVALNAELDRGTGQLSTPNAGSFTQDVHAVAHEGSWAIVWESHAVTPVHMDVFAVSATDYLGGVDQRPEEIHTGILLGPDETPTASRRYRHTQGNASLGRVPRTTFGNFPYASARFVEYANRVGNDASAYPSGRLYVGDSVALDTSIQAAAIEWESNGTEIDGAGGPPNQDDIIAEVTAVDATNRTIDLHDRAIDTRVLGAAGPKWHSASGPGIVNFRLGRSYTRGSLANFLTSLHNIIAANLNLGAVPDIRSSDFTAIASTDIPDAALRSALLGTRGYTLFAPVSFAEFLEQECRLLGVFPHYASDGTVTFSRIRLPAPGEVGTTITSADIINGDGEWVSYERAPLGMFSTVELSTYYDAVKEEHTGIRHKVRDLEAFGQSPSSRTLQIKPYSRDGLARVTTEDVLSIADPVLGTFGGPYAYITIAVKLTLIDTLLGDVVDLTYDKVPNTDGTLGVTNKIGIVVGREIDIRAARMVLTILVTDQKVGGYVPSALISSIDSGTSGTTGPFTVTVDTDDLKSGDTAADIWAANDKVRLYKLDSTDTTLNETASLTSVSGNQLTFSTDAAWTHSGATWCVGSQVSTSITAAGQKKHVYLGNTDATLDFSGDTGNQAFTLA